MHMSGISHANLMQFLTIPQAYLKKSQFFDISEVNLMPISNLIYISYIKKSIKVIGSL